MLPFGPCKSNKLVDAIGRRDWAYIIKICESELQEGEDHNLHHHHQPHEASNMAKQRCRVKLAGDKSTSVMLPLHYIVIVMVTSTTITDDYDDDNDGAECLHAIKVLTKVYPHALECKESSQHRTPLHLACLHPDEHRNQSNTTTTTATTATTTSVPASEQSVGGTKRRAAHHGSGSEELVQFLLKAHPDAAMERDRLLRLPLHYAVAGSFNHQHHHRHHHHDNHDRHHHHHHDRDEIIGLGTATGSDDDGSGGAIRALLDQYPEATTTRDGQGWLPLHVACHYKSSFDTIQALYAVNPDAVVAQTPLDRETPYDLVKKQQVQVEDDDDFKDKHEILDFLAEKAKYYVPTPTPFMDSFVTDNFIHPIY